VVVIPRHEWVVSNPVREFKSEGRWAWIRRSRRAFVSKLRIVRIWLHFREERVEEERRDGSRDLQEDCGTEILWTSKVKTIGGKRRWLQLDRGHSLGLGMWGWKSSRYRSNKNISP
jgi:hypothetical protein